MLLISNSYVDKNDPILCKSKCKNFIKNWKNLGTECIHVAVLKLV